MYFCNDVRVFDSGGIGYFCGDGSGNVGFIVVYWMIGMGD